MLANHIVPTLAKRASKAVFKCCDPITHNPMRAEFSLLRKNWPKSDHLKIRLRWFNSDLAKIARERIPSRFGAVIEMLPNS